MEREGKRVFTNARWCKGCGICVAFCPQGVLGLVKQKIRILEPEKCTRCGLCEMRCPDYAIWLDVDEECRLAVRFEDGSIEKLSSGEISVRLY